MTGLAQIIARGSARVPGSCGELVQGMIDGSYFLVSCPIDMYSTATVELSCGGGGALSLDDISKSRRAVKLTLKRFGRRDVHARLKVSSELPRGKGMASSTADVCASIAATADALAAKASISPYEIARIAALVEPTDSVVLPGISKFDHRSGKIADTLGSPPPMRVVILDFGGRVDTIAFNSVHREGALKCLEPLFEEALALITRGIERGNAEEIAEGATISAVTNQKLLYKPQLDSVMRLAEGVGALGVNVAHSGSVLGMLFANDTELTSYAASHTWKKLSGIKRIYDRRIVNGGVVSAKTTEHNEEGSQWQ